MSSSGRKISPSAVRRLSLYLRTLEALEAGGTDSAPSRTLARGAGTTAAQVRKDLSLFGSFGKRGLGYAVEPLRERIREILGLARSWRVGLVGAGRIGTALYEYPNLRERGFRILAIVDADPAKAGRRWAGVTIRPADELEEAFREVGVEIAILAVPAGAAQSMADRVVEAGIRGLLNFAPVQLSVPSGVTVKEVNLALELEALSFALRSEP